MFGSHQFYDFRRGSWSEVKTALDNLVKAKEKIIGQTSAALKLYEYAEPIIALANSKSFAGAADIADREAMCFLDVDLAAEFLADPTDAGNGDALSLELAFIAAAVGVAKNVVPYDDRELGLVLDGDDRFYNDLIFAGTLGSLIGRTGGEKIAARLARSLPLIKPKEDIKQTYFWVDAFIFSLMLQAAWSHFKNLEAGDRQFLLQNYFYLGIVLGVPVRWWISELLRNKSDEDYNILSREIAKNLEASHESVPLSDGDITGRPLADLVREFMPKIQPTGVIELELGSMVDKFYKNQVDEAFFSSWLREAVSILLHLKKGDIDTVSNF